MGFFAASFRMNIKRIIRPSMAFVFVIFYCALVVGVFVKREFTLQPAVGVFCEKDTVISQEIVSNLHMFSNISIEAYDDMEEMLEDIAAVKIESGYAINVKAEEYIKNGNINKAVKLYKSNATMTDGFTNELLYAALLRAAAPYISANYLNGKTYDSYDMLLKEAKEEMELYYKNGEFMNIDIIESGGGFNGDEKKSNSINAGIVSVFIFILFFYITIEGIESKKDGFFLKLRASEGAVYTLTYVAANGVLILLFVAPSVLFISETDVLKMILGTGAYVSFLSGVSFLAICLFKSARLLYAFFPLIAIFVVFFGGVFFDLSVINPIFGKVSMLFPTYHFVVYIL